MSNQLKTVLTAMLFAGLASANAADVQINGTVASKCTISTDTAGVYANPTADVLTTATTDGGIPAVVRFDVVSANSYKAVISTPVSFATSPALSDTLDWTGSSEVSQVTDPAMSAYDTNKRVYNNTTEFDLTVAGTVWFKSNSAVTYGYNKSLPGGNYTAIVVAECVAL